MLTDFHNVSPPDPAENFTDMRPNSPKPPIDKNTHGVNIDAGSGVGLSPRTVWEHSRGSRGQKSPSGIQGPGQSHSRLRVWGMKGEPFYERSPKNINYSGRGWRSGPWTTGSSLLNTVEDTEDSKPKKWPPLKSINRIRRDWLLSRRDIQSSL